MVAIPKDVRRSQVNRPLHGILIGVVLGGLLWSLVIGIIVAV